MSYLRAALLTILCTLTLAMAQAPQPQKPAADITGNWAATFETPIGEMKYTYEFKVAADGTLTGTSVGPLGTSPLTEGSVKGDVVTFVEMLDSAIKCIYTGTIVTKDEITFNRVVGDFGTEELVARRVEPAK